jgi:hypothetical protein
VCVLGLLGFSRDDRSSSQQGSLPPHRIALHRIHAFDCITSPPSPSILPAAPWNRAAVAVYFHPLFPHGPACGLLARAHTHTPLHPKVPFHLVSIPPSPHIWLSLSAFVRVFTFHPAPTASHPASHHIASPAPQATALTHSTAAQVEGSAGPRNDALPVLGRVLEYLASCHEHTALEPRHTGTWLEVKVEEV